MKKIILENPLTVGLGILLSFDFLLSIFRVCYTGERYFLFLIWNLFLAFLPFALISCARLIDEFKSAKLLVLSLLGLCILFLPNAPYIVTDLFHLKYWKGQAPLWFDTMLIFSYAITGLVFFYATILSLERLFLKYFRPFFANILIVSLLFLSSFGVYLGRYLRFNSWDIITDPIGLFLDILTRLIYPLSHPRAWGLTLMYGVLFLVGLFCIKLFDKSLEYHYSKEKK